MDVIEKGRRKVNKHRCTVPFFPFLTGFTAQCAHEIRITPPTVHLDAYPLRLVLRMLAIEEPFQPSGPSPLSWPAFARQLKSLQLLLCESAADTAPD